MIQSVGAYFQCYKNSYATYKCLESFRKFYPTSTVILLSDNGYNYSEMAKLFECIYIHSNESITFINDNMDENVRIDHGNKLINRIKTSFNLIKEDYVLWLEDDVIINDKINCILEYDLNGFCPNKVSNFWNINEIQKKYNFIEKNKEYVWSGQGGSIYNKNIILQYFKNISISNDILLNWIKYNFTSNICQDFFFSIIIHFNKGSIGPYHGHADCSYQNSNIIVQHQFKTFYNTNLPLELQYLCKTN